MPNLHAAAPPRARSYNARQVPHRRRTSFRNFRRTPTMKRSLIGAPAPPPACGSRSGQHRIGANFLPYQHGRHGGHVLPDRWPDRQRDLATCGAESGCHGGRVQWLRRQCQRHSRRRAESGFSQADVAYWATRAPVRLRASPKVTDLRLIANLYPKASICRAQSSQHQDVADPRGKRFRSTSQAPARW